VEELIITGRVHYMRRAGRVRIGGQGGGRPGGGAPRGGAAAGCCLQHLAPAGESERRQNTNCCCACKKAGSRQPTAHSANLLERLRRFGVLV
jgi:hypothetical protein